MSHQPERKDKTCLNCGTEVLGRFCQVCGQENIITHQNFWSLSKHFIYDIFHFDGKFFDTVRYLLVKPGYVAKEYAKGKRMSYLDPIRMYLFTSALFFLIFFKFVSPKPTFNIRDNDSVLSKKERVHLIDSIQRSLGYSIRDSIKRAKLESLKDTSRSLSAEDIDLFDHGTVNIGKKHFKTIDEYKAYQKSLPSDQRDGWFRRRLIEKSINVNKKYEGNLGELLKEFLEAFLHRLPIMLFFSLPFFALILKLLYTRRKTYFYSDHAVFTLYQYIFSFLLLLVLFAFGRLSNATNWSIFGWLMAAGIIYGGYYLLRSMKYFYGQSWKKTFVKFILLNFLGGFALLLLLLVFFIFSIVEL